MRFTTRQMKSRSEFPHNRIYRQYEDDVDWDLILSKRNRLQNLSKDVDSTYDILKNKSLSKDKRTLDHFDYVVKSNYTPSRFTTTTSTKPAIIYESSTPSTRFVQHYSTPSTPISRRYVPHYYSTPTDEILPSSNLKAHPKMIINDYFEPSNRVFVAESENSIRLKNLENRLDNLIGYRNPRYYLSEPTKHHVDQITRNSARRFYNTNIHENEPIYLSKKRFINHRIYK